MTPAVIAGEGIKIFLGWGSLIALSALGLVVAIRSRKDRSRKDRSRVDAKMPVSEGTGITG